MINARTVFPFDWRTMRESLAKTGRLVVVDDTNRMAGLAGEIVATAAEEYADLLREPPVRLTRAEGAVPFAVDLERAIVPSAPEIRAVLEGFIDTQASKQKKEEEQS